MNQVLVISATIALLGSALVGGIFFAFSSFVMKALAQVPSSQGIAAMQSINVVVLNRSFLGTFFGTAVLSAWVLLLVVLRGDGATSGYMVGGALLYVVGTFLVTVVGNVPLNNRLAAISADGPSAEDVWQQYLVRWTRWNHVRTVAALAAALLFVVGLLHHAAA